MAQGMTTVYPRVCGGSAAGEPYGLPAPGLSPRVRGKRGVADDNGRRMGSIPACAGEAPTAAARPARPAVYPRVCGGSEEVISSIVAELGLSPRVRGKPPLTAPGHPMLGSIPACAGEAT